MKPPLFLLAALVALAPFQGAFAAETAETATPAPLPLDTDIVINTIGIACTGIGGIKHDPRWNDYSLRVEFANSQHEYLIGAIVTLTDQKGTELLNVSCEAPWVLLKLPDHSSYRLTARLTDVETPLQVRTVKAPAKGQIREVITFPGT